MSSSGSGGGAESGRSAHGEEDEGVLRDVLAELDRERSRRAELEAQVRKLTQEKETLQSKHEELQREAAALAENSKKENDVAQEQTITRRAFITMETQVEEYRNLIDKLTLGKPAFAAAAAAEAEASAPASSSSRRGRNVRKSSSDASRAGSSNRKSLPLYVVRLLEVIPWDPRAKEHILGTEEVYEWQVYDVREKNWQSQLRSFPASFKALPVVRPQAGGGVTVKTGKGNLSLPSPTKQSASATSSSGEGTAAAGKERSLLVFLAGGGEKSLAPPSKHAVFTDKKLTRVINIETGFPLPDDGGTWEWIGGWRIEKRVAVETNSSHDDAKTKQRVDCDENGWSYAVEPNLFEDDPAESVWESPGTMTTAAGTVEILRKIRRRKWTRRRMLLDYPYASERTREFLKLMAENARISVTVDKISEQLVETKVALTGTEERLIQSKSGMSLEMDKLRGDLKSATDLLKAAGIDTSTLVTQNTDGNSVIQEFLAKNEQVKEFGTKISQWVSSARKSGDDSSSNLESTEPVAENNSVGASSRALDDIQQRFDWKKFGRGGLMEKIKQTHSNAQKRVAARRSVSAEEVGVTQKSSSTSLEDGSRETKSQSDDDLLEELQSIDDILDIDCPRSRSDSDLRDSRERSMTG